MERLRSGQNFQKFKIVQFITTALKSILAKVIAPENWVGLILVSASETMAGSGNVTKNFPEKFGKNRNSEKIFL